MGDALRSGEMLQLEDRTYLSFRNCDYTICGLVSCSVLSCGLFRRRRFALVPHMADRPWKYPDNWRPPSQSSVCRPPVAPPRRTQTRCSQQVSLLSLSLSCLCVGVCLDLSFSCLSVNCLVVDRTPHGHAQQGLCRMNTVSSSLLSMTISTCVQPGSHRLGLDTPARSVT